jgi:hypothetical protein
MAAPTQGEVVEPKHKTALPPKTANDAQAFLIDLARAIEFHGDGPIVERAIDAARAAWKAYRREGVREVKTLRQERAWSLLVYAVEVQKTFPQVSARDLAETSVAQEREVAEKRGDALADVPVERWQRAIERLSLGTRRRGRPATGDLRFSRDEILARLLNGEPTHGTTTKRAKNLYDARKKAALRKMK